MPVRELGGSFDPPNGAQAVGATLLKKHKILPHPREQRVQLVHPPTTKPQDLNGDPALSEASSDTSSPRTLKHTSRRIGVPVLPPTPPTHSRQSSGSHSTIASAPRYESTSRNLERLSSAPGTPPNQQSPPTPDFTPPRGKLLAVRSSPTDRQASYSRSDSFKTARENPYSSDEDVASTTRRLLPSSRPLEVRTKQSRPKNTKYREVGLGLGLESDNEGTTTPRADKTSQQEFVVFDGDWGYIGEEVSEVEREWDDNLMRNVTVRKRNAPRPYQRSRRATTEVLEDDIVSPTLATKVVRGLPLQERIARRRSERDTQRSCERIVQPSAASDFEPPATPDVRRFSATSGRSATSTIVGALVVDSLPERRQTLRHTKKHLGLRDLSDQSTVTSGPSSVISNETQHKLPSKTTRIPERRHRSLVSNATISTTSSGGRSRRQVLNDGGIPVVVIPGRRSSTKSSKAPSLRSTSSRKTKRSVSLSSAPLSQSSKFNEPGYLSHHQSRKRASSESGGSGPSVRTIDYPPNIPARRSSLSAPTSRNASRAGSLTAESLKAHNMLQYQETIKPEPTQSHPLESQKEFGQSTRLNVVDHNGDPFFGNRRSTQATPFSQLSYDTAFTTAEVSEALAVSLFPHQNKSLLVVEQQAAPGALSSIPNTLIHSQPGMTVNGEPTAGPATPPQRNRPTDEVDSPLRNPRAPPEPPAIKFIPPTPAAFTPEDEEDRQLGYDQRPAKSDRPKRSISLIRRTFSNRRNSETALSARSGFLKRTFSLGGHRKGAIDGSIHTSGGNGGPSTLYPSVVDRPADESKLHPFWRPSHFWDDLEDHDGDSDGYDGRYGNGPSLGRSLSGRLKRTFAILPVQDNRSYPLRSGDRRTMRRSASGNMRVVKQRSDSSLRRQASGRRVSEAGQNDERRFGYGFPDGNGGKKVHELPSLGIRVEYVGWSEMRRRMSERRREQRSKKLRASISNPRGVQNGTDDVLRRWGEA